MTHLNTDSNDSGPTARLGGDEFDREVEVSGLPLSLEASVGYVIAPFLPLAEQTSRPTTH